MLVLANKRKEPSAPQALEPLSESWRVAAELVVMANAAAVEHNATVGGIGQEKMTLTAQVWRFVLNDMKSDLDAYGVKKKSLGAAIPNLQQQIKSAD